MDTKLVKKLEKLFEDAALAWEAGNNGETLLGHAVPAYGKAANMRLMEKKCNELHAEAEKILAAFKVEVDYPGLYPSFRYEGHDYHDVKSLMVEIDRRTKNS